MNQFPNFRNPALTARYQEDFTRPGLAQYIGNSALFSFAGGIVTGAVNNAAGGNTMFIPFPARFNGRYFECEGIVTADNLDDSPAVGWSNDTQTLAFTMRREAALDAARRCLLQYPGGSQFIGAGALTIGTWYRFVCSLRPGIGNSTAAIFDATTGALFASAAIAIDLPSFFVGFSQMFIDAGNVTPTCPGQMRRAIASA